MPPRRRRTMIALLPLAQFVLLVSPSWWCPSVDAQRRVAIIGGGISGTFAARYLSEYDADHRRSAKEGGGGGVETRDCLLDEIVVYDVSPPPGGLGDRPPGAGGATPGWVGRGGSGVGGSSDPRPGDWQGSRVASVTLGADGAVVELGASIVYEGNRLVVEMMDGDPSFLRRADPTGMSLGEDKDDDDGDKGEEGKRKSGPRGFGIYHGDGEWLLNTSHFSRYYPSFLGSTLESLYVLWRYGLDLFRIRRAVRRAETSFNAIYAALDDTEHEVTYFDGPMEIWRAMGLSGQARSSFHDYLDGLGLRRDATMESNGGDGGGSAGWWDWRRWIPGTGCLRSELLSAIALNTYNQDLNQMNGLVGLVSYAPAGGKIFSVEGGNHLLMESALRQARKTYESSSCEPSRRRVHRHQKKVTTVVASEDSLELFEDDDDAPGKEKKSLGKYDVVILAAPLQQCRIRFLVESPMGLDDAVLHDMPLGGIEENLDSEGMTSSPSSSPSSASNEHGHRSFASILPPSATAPYTSVVTTLVSNATLNSSHFGLRCDELLPRSVLVSERGKALEGITTLTILSHERGLIKTFSSETLSPDKRNALFGANHVVEYVQVWGGRYGGATPSFGGGRNSESLPFLLYDGAKHWGKVDGPALYYVNAIESAVAAIEISAIGAKSTAKLVARRLGLTSPIDIVKDHEEL